MSGSLDNENLRIVDAREAILTLVVWGTGSVEIQCRVPKQDGTINHAWVARTLRHLAAAEDAQEPGLSTIEDLAAISYNSDRGEGTIIKDLLGEVYERQDDGTWTAVGHTRRFPDRSIQLPARIIWEPPA